MTLKKRLLTIYLIADYVSTLVALLLFVVARFNFEPFSQRQGSVEAILSTPMFKVEMILYPLVMLMVYWLTGFYSEVIMKSRIQEFIQTFKSTLIGIGIFFFIAIINDVGHDRAITYRLLLILAAILMCCTYFTRLIITSIVHHDILKGRIWRNTIIVGSVAESRDMYTRLKKVSRVMGIKVIGFVYTDTNASHTDPATPDGLPIISIDDALDQIDQGSITTVVVAPPADDTPGAIALINRFLPTDCSVLVDYNFYLALSAPVRTQDVIGEPMVDVSHTSTPPSTLNMKRCLDVIISSLALLILWPVFLVIALLVKLDSHGSVIYRQERVGRHKKPFTIYKFRSMYVDAESKGPQLSSDSDPRITRIGHVLRKYRLDELPQFWNILKGDMSLVGPRPEREYFVKRITQRAPSYALLQQLRPGLTSWGMVKYGYASSVDEMVERLRYDIIYLDNVSILLDTRIILYTIKIVLTGKGV